MDRFIEQEHTSYAPCQLSLKSNMDRFIGFLDFFMYLMYNKFKIQYG